MTEKKLEVFLHGLAEPIRSIDPITADALHYVAANLHKLHDRYRVPSVIECQECDSAASVVEWICPTSEDFARGYRAIYRCTNSECGEMVVR